jgi:phage gp29-like protein
MPVLYDAFGREVQVKAKPETREIAVTTIRDRWSTYPSSGLTPVKLAAIFKEADQGDVYRQAELFEEMEEKDPHLAAEFGTRKNAVLGLDYDVQPFSDSAEDKKISDFVSDAIFGLEDLETALLDMLDAIPKGYSLTEIMWGIDASRVVIEDLCWVHAKRAVFYERGNDQWAKSFEVPRITTQAEPIYGEIMPPFKLLYHRYKARSGYDTRAGLLRVCAWMYLFKNYAIKDWAAFAEVFGMPLRIGKYDPGASSDDKEALVAAVQSLGSDAAGIISKNTEIQFVETTKGASTDNVYQALAEFANSEMSKAILGQTATSTPTPGSLGNQDAQDRVRHDLVRADAEALSRTVRFQLIRPLVGYNFGWDKQLPWFKIFHEPPEDLQAASTVLVNISKLGFPITAEYVSDRFKIPLPGPKDQVLQAPAGPGGFGGPLPLKRLVAKSLDPEPAERAAEGPKNAPDDPQSPGDTLTRLGDKALALADFGPFLDPVVKLLDESTDLVDFQSRLADAFKGMDISELGTLIQKSMILAELAGRFDALPKERQ